MSDLSHTPYKNLRNETWIGTPKTTTQNKTFAKNNIIITNKTKCHFFTWFNTSIWIKKCVITRTTVSSRSKTTA